VAPPTTGATVVFVFSLLHRIPYVFLNIILCIAHVLYTTRLHVCACVFIYTRIKGPAKPIYYYRIYLDGAYVLTKCASWSAKLTVHYRYQTDQEGGKGERLSLTSLATICCAHRVALYRPRLVYCCNGDHMGRVYARSVPKEFERVYTSYGHDIRCMNAWTSSNLLCIKCIMLCLSSEEKEEKNRLPARRYCFSRFYWSRACIIIIYTVCCTRQLMCPKS
jgi:hypothetical protein